MTPPKTFLLWLAAGLMIALGAGCASEEAAVEPVEAQARPVRTTVVAEVRPETDKAFSGLVRAAAELRLGFSAGGTVETINVAVGDPVKTGDVLAVLDTRNMDAQLAEAKAGVTQASAQLKAAKRRQETLAKLLASGGTSRLEYDMAKADVDAAQGGVSAARQRVKQLENASDDTALEAPEDGFVASVPVNQGEVVGAGSAVVTLNTGALPEVSVAVPASLLSRVAVGNRARITSTLLGDTPLEGEVIEKGVSPDKSGATYEVVVRLDAPDPRIAVGMAVSARIDLTATDAPAIVLPTGAIAEDNAGTYVMKVVEGAGETTAQRATVALGRVLSDGIEVTEGVVAGDRIVTAGVHGIDDGEAIVLADVAEEVARAAD